MPKKSILVFFTFIFICSTTTFADNPPKKRIFVVDSYHPQYLWSQETHQGLCKALLDFKLLDNEDQAAEFIKNGFIESSQLVLKNEWMDTKRKDSKPEIAEATARIYAEIQDFKPDLILLGDDNAANYIGNLFIDTNVPVVFWGINIFPTKYGLVDSMEKPDHNITGVYQPGYIVETVDYLTKLVPSIKTLGILSDGSETARAKAKEIQKLSDEGKLAAKVVDAVMTNSFSEWKNGALQLQDKVDGIFVVNHNTLKDDDGQPVDQMVAGNWYLNNIKKPDCGDAKQFVQEGILVTADDSGFKQGYEAMEYGHQILYEGIKAAVLPVKAPARGLVMVNRQRAAMLNIDISQKDFIEEFVDTAMALQKK